MVGCFLFQFGRSVEGSEKTCLSQTRVELILHRRGHLFLYFLSQFLPESIEKSEKSSVIKLTIVNNKDYTNVLTKKCI